MSLPVVACLVALVLAVAAGVFAAYKLVAGRRTALRRPFSEKRMYLRTPLNCRAVLSDTGSQPGRVVAVRCADISQYGARVICPAPLQPGTSVVLVIPTLRLTGIGAVRHSTKRRTRYVLGLEFNAPLQRTEIGDWIIQSASQPKSA